MTGLELSPAQAFLSDCLEVGADVDALLDGLTVQEQAGLSYDWRRWWARPKQIINVDSSWRSHGFLAGRRFGKSRANCEVVIELVMAGRAPIIGLIAQTDADVLRVQIKGEAGLLACSPPWFPAVYEGGEVSWVNGARAIVFTPQRPGNIRGDGVHLLWMVELQSWPVAKRQRALENALALCSLGEARVLWDATSKRRHPLIGAMLRDADEDPDNQIVVRGEISENRLSLSQGAIDDLYRKHTRRGPDGSILRDEQGQPILTQRGREELHGEFSQDDEGALWRDDWIVHRVPSDVVETVVSIDPAITAEAGSDETGIVVAGLDADGCFVVLEDHTGKMRWEQWGDIAIDLYRQHRATCLVVERNRGGDAVAANIRARAMPQNIRVTVLDRKRKSRPKRHDPNTIFVREITAYDSKWNRAEPVAGLYEARLAYHDPRGSLGELEYVMTTWEPSPGVRSPNALDALTQAANELVDLEGRQPIKRPPITGASELQKQATRQTASRKPLVSSLLSSSRRVSRI